MVGMLSKVLAAAGVFAAGALAQSVDPIVIKGSKFFYKTNGTEFYIRGVAYQQDYNGNGSTGAASGSGAGSYNDPLATLSDCQRDLPYLQKLNTNTVRVYAVDPTKDHSGCMNLFASAGIYVIADLASPGESINQLEPTWTEELYERYTSVVDAFQNYTNVLGFFAGNEVAIAPNSSYAADFVKAAVRDTKAYIQSQKYRDIGVGYATADVPFRLDLADFLDCGDPATTIDFWGYNIYEWCGNSSYQASGYEARTQELANYSIPAFFAEYGCLTPPRDFTDVPVLFGDNMTEVFSGGIVYEFFEAANDFGLVTIDSSGSLSTLDAFNAYSSQINQVSPTLLNSASYTPTNTQEQNCPQTGASWSAVPTPLPPAVNEDLCNCMYDSLSCVVDPSTNENMYGQLFGQVCGDAKGVCDGITANMTIQSFYGAYSMCNATQRLSFAFNQYAAGQQNNPSACNFGGAASSKSTVAASGTCSALLNQAGSAGTGTVTSSPSGTGAGAGGSTSKGAAGQVSPQQFQSGYLQMGLYVAVAVMSGAGMILL